jgi:hypothetical protein
MLRVISSLGRARNSSHGQTRGSSSSPTIEKSRHHCPLSAGSRTRSIHSSSCARTWLSNAAAERSGLLADLDLSLMVFLLYLGAVATLSSGS